MPESNKKETKAFDAVAEHYDAEFSHTTLGRLLRERVWYCTGDFSRLNPAAKVAGTVLELNCGTGEDAIWFAKQGYQVLATDASPEMVAVAKSKIEQTGLANRANVQVCSFAAIAQLPEAGFDLIFSNFGGLNCMSPEDLSRFGSVIAQKLKPGGKFVAVVMGRFCWWETLYFLLKGNPREAFRRFSHKAVNARLDANTTVPTWYYSPSEFRKRLQAYIKTQGAYGRISSQVHPIGFWLPPSYLNPFFEKRPKSLAFLNFLEKKWAPSCLAFAADHFIICLDNPKN